MDYSKIKTTVQLHYEDEKPCKVCGCPMPVDIWLKTGGYCIKHYQQAQILRERTR